MTNKNYNRRVVTTYCLVDPSTDSSTQTTLAKYQLIYSIIGLALGLVAIIGGIYLFIKGVTGSMNWSAKILGAESNLVDAAPGAVLFIVGLFVVFVTRFKFKHAVAK